MLSATIDEGDVSSSHASTTFLKLERNSKPTKPSTQNDNAMLLHSFPTCSTISMRRTE